MLSVWSGAGTGAGFGAGLPGQRPRGLDAVSDDAGLDDAGLDDVVFDHQSVLAYADTCRRAAARLDESSAVRRKEAIVAGREWRGYKRSVFDLDVAGLVATAERLAASLRQAASAAQDASDAARLEQARREDERERRAQERERERHGAPADGPADGDPASLVGGFW